MNPDAVKTIESVLNEFPEVTWDRWAGSEGKLSAFGWIRREDQHSDFVLVRIQFGQLQSVATSSAKYSDIFAERLGLCHIKCNRVEVDFPNVRSIHLHEPKKSTEAA